MSALFRWLILSLALLAGVFAAAPAPACAFRPTAVETISLPDRPFGIRATADGCWLFVSLFGRPQAGGAIAVLRNERGDFRLDHVAKLPGLPSGLSLAANERLLAVAAEDRILLLDVGKLERGDEQPVVSDIEEPGFAGFIEAQFALQDRLLFASEERKSAIAVVDVSRAEQGDSAHAIVGRVTAGVGPVGLALSPDGRRLFATSEIADAFPAVASRCAPPRPGLPAPPEGLLIAIDVEAAATEPAKSVRASRAAGCSPVRVAVSADGSTVWVSARGDDSLLAFPARELAGARSSIPPVRRQVGLSPVGVAVRPDGAQVWVANSDRFSASGSGTLTCLPLSDGGEGQVRTGKFPRELIFLPDGKTLAVTVFGSNELQLVPTAIPGRPSAMCMTSEGGAP